jgi:CBS domain-containing protein
VEDWERGRLTVENTVLDALDRVGAKPVIVSEAASIRDIAEASDGHAEVRIICVVNGEGRLRGLIRTSALCDEIYFHLVPEEFLVHIFEPERLAEFGRFGHAHTAADLMEPAVSVQEDDSIVLAFRRMHQHDLEGLPVIDAEGRPISYLDRLRLVSIWIKAQSQKSSGN